jgi:hypothetical protein
MKAMVADPVGAITYRLSELSTDDSTLLHFREHVQNLAVFALRADPVH